jgi:hypothetical protein
MGHSNIGTGRFGRFGTRCYVEFEAHNKIQIHSSSPWQKMSQDCCCKVLCVITCLWIFALPIYLSSKKKTSGRIVANWRMGVSGEEFYQRNYWNIVQAVTSRYRGDVMAV